MTPEHDAQLGQVRRWLRDLRRSAPITILPSHDRAAILASGIGEL